tara:strand:- start:867 stop:1724 length:858 start_codon:yes stop_codon:yes gene_type:complete
MRILTFDIEDWFHLLEHPASANFKNWKTFEWRLREGVEGVLDILDGTAHKATFFCLGWVAEEFPEVVREISGLGHEVASHSMYHELVHEHSPKSFAADLTRSKQILEDISGVEVTAFRAPGFSITSECPWAFDEILSAGYSVDCSIFPASRSHGGLREGFLPNPSMISLDSGNLKCLPMNTVPSVFGDFVFSGGGYFRLLPSWYLRYKFRTEPYVMTYFHPRDFDANQPIMKGLSLRRRFKAYVGIRGAKQKLRGIVAENSFMSVSEAVDHIDWLSVPTSRVSDV